jgi:hypothetical protein
MIRKIKFILLIGLCAVPLIGRAKNGQDSAGQTSDKGAVEQTAAVTPAISSFPLDKFTEFSAIMVGSRMGVGDEAHIYRSGSLMRVEGPEGKGYFLTDLSSLETLGITAGGCVRDPHPYFRTSPFPAVRPGFTVDRVAAERQTVDGHSCQIEEVSVSSPLKGAAPLRMRLWEAENLQGFPIKIEFPSPGGKKSTTIQYKNVVLGPQDPTLFIRPKSCTQLLQKDEPKKPKAPSATKKAQK